MKNVSKLALVLTSSMLSLSVADATAIPNPDHPVTYLGPSLHASYTNAFNYSSAYSVLGEIGSANYRVGGTLGWQFEDSQRFKMSAEYLWERVNFNFFPGNSGQWVSQYAFGGDYQADLNWNFSPKFNYQFDLGAYFAHAPSRRLSTVSGFYPHGSSVVGFMDQRRIAGSNTVNVSPGLSVQPWYGSKVSVAINYDNVHYDTSYSSNHNASGFGGTARLDQSIVEFLNLGLEAGVRQPYNNYAATLTWVDANYMGKWSVGLFGNYTVGKNTLTSSYDGGITANYMGDSVPLPRHDIKGESYQYGDHPMSPHNASFMSWMADPAVYMPRVLAIADQTLGNCNGSPPTLLAPIVGFPPSSPFPTFAQGTLNVSGNFSGSNLSYYLSATPDPQIDQNGFSINSQTGIISIQSSTFVDFVEYAVTVTAANGCGSVSATFPITIAT